MGAKILVMKIRLMFAITASTMVSTSFYQVDGMAIDVFLYDQAPCAVFSITRTVDHELHYDEVQNMLHN